MDISGISIKTKEALIDIVLKLDNLVKIKEVKEVINNLYHIKKTENSNTISNIVVKFNYMNKKVELITAFKAQYKIKPIVVTDLFPKFTSSRTYMNDHLSTHNKKILWIAKQVVKNYDFK